MHSAIVDDEYAGELLDGGWLVFGDHERSDGAVERAVALRRGEQ